MSFKLQRASSVAMAAMFFSTLLGAQGSGAIAQDKFPAAVQTGPAPQTISQPVVQPLPEAQLQPAVARSDDDDAAPSAATLDALVSAQTQPGELSPEMRCLAGAIYFEAKSEPLSGQLAVARVVVNRARSGRFPDSYCGVVYQRSQFSFVHGHSMPAINTASHDWRDAVAIAQIADADTWRSSAEGALYFHAARVSPNWHATRVARIGNHVFYR
jgi:spore germination cell wall hydrolase CwlJ-like protein